METPLMSSFLVIVHLLILMFYLGGGNAIESPQYTVVLSESDFEVRLYRETSWISAPVQGTSSFKKATKDGFHRLYKYIHGSNLNSSIIPISAPVLTTINASSPNEGGSEYYVRLFLSAIYEKPPLPSPELNLQLFKWKSHCIAVREFSGFAKDDNINKELEALKNSLNKQVDGKTSMVEDKSSYSIAQYNSSREPTERLNEVWINVSGSAAEGCLNHK
ncbi:uncharacterized protein LOC107428572 [Ziziphus jujuba]|uniref:Uncharacterized protein LOC107428572 n=1 Tax=Ziziphus jujuba TaxID=326968 RepID=A0A6P4AGD4_ZIZJJ|nr:uncharacterized protein LOC107428572 [Ziziphus jujuba]